jgi:hypothetical protein
MQISLDFLHNGCSNRLHFDVGRLRPNIAKEITNRAASWLFSSLQLYSADLIEL